MDGTYLRAWRKGQALTQAQAAETIGISRRMFQQYELGVYETPLIVRLAVAAVEMGVTDWPPKKRRPSTSG